MQHIGKVYIEELMQCKSLEENKRGVTQCHRHSPGEKVLACKHDNATLWWPESLIAVLTPLHKAREYSNQEFAI